MEIIGWFTSTTLFTPIIQWGQSQSESAAGIKGWGTPNTTPLNRWKKNSMWAHFIMRLPPIQKVFNLNIVYSLWGNSLQLEEHHACPSGLQKSHIRWPKPIPERLCHHQHYHCNRSPKLCPWALPSKRKGKHPSKGLRCQETASWGLIHLEEKRSSNLF